ncbi:MAG: ATP-dependent DNA helicase RecG [Alphaproteobacteria bacterium]|nr:ATP-dependent DNA helicase RecG [Alphaproteobacteria bacterium]
MVESLEYFFQSLIQVKGVGDKFFQGLRRLLPNTRFKDILFHFPVDVIDRSYTSQIMDAEVGRVVTLKVDVLKHIPAPYIKGRKIPYKVLCSDDSGFITLNFFNAGNYLLKSMPVGAKLCISGKIEDFDGGRCMNHPNYIVPVNQFEKIAGLEPVYPLTYAITNKMIRNVVDVVLNNLPRVPEWQNDANISFTDSLKIIHRPIKNMDMVKEAKRRIAYDEILANQLVLAISRNKFKTESGAKIIPSGEFIEPFVKSFGYELTGAQKRVLSEVMTDLKSENRMLRLLQGDVGSGKTIIAMIALLATVESGGQGAFMVPTEILAQQHFETFTKLLDKSGLSDKIRIILLTGKDKGKIKTEKLSLLENGLANIVIGTHAIFQEKVKFKNLLLSVIDEQHKFGVHQRLSLTNKNSENKCNILTMTATPIPRTLAMTSFGDMDLSIIDEMPPNRKEVETKVMNMNKIDELIHSIEGQINLGILKKLYWVCPLVEESDKIDLSDAISRYESLKTVFGDSVALIHGKMKSDEKDEIMQEFANPNGKIKILVATTVIEVGVNVPEATLMIIEHSERFGLSSLHQLRGRIGRGADKSICILLHSSKMTLVAKERLAVMKETTDGFKIAEKDLKLRGAGDILGVRQSGLVDFKIASLEDDYDLFLAASQDVKNIISIDMKNNTERWQNLKYLLQLFEYTGQIKNMKA